MYAMRPAQCMRKEGCAQGERKRFSPHKSPSANPQPHLRTANIG